MYGKIFESMYNGTLVEDWQALITFQQMIILCDSDGILDMTVGAIARRTGIPIQYIQHGIEILEGEDIESRSPSESGKRIIRIDEHRAWGWHIVNHKHYRNLRTSNDRREYMRIYMRNKRKELTKTNESLQVNKLANTDTDTDTDTKEHKGTIVPLTGTDVPPCPHNKIVSIYHEVLPELAAVREWTPSRERLLKTRWKENPERQSLTWWREYFEYVRQCPHLMGQNDRSWEATLEWLIKPANFVKVIEGNYEPKAKSL